MAALNMAGSINIGRSGVGAKDDAKTAPSDGVGGIVKWMGVKGTPPMEPKVKTGAGAAGVW